MSFERLKNLYYSAKDNENDSDIVPLKVTELRDLLVAVDTLRMVAGDISILQASLEVDRGHTMVRSSDLKMIEDLREFVSTSKSALRPLEAEDILDGEAGEFILEVLPTQSLPVPNNVINLSHKWDHT